MIHTDHLGTPQLITDSTQDVVWEATYTPFGEATILTETITNNIRGIGQYFDAETGLLYNYFRYLDPKLGRYYTSDPIGLGGGMSTYAHVYNNPLFWIDPYGLEVKICCRPAEIAFGLVDHCWVTTDMLNMSIGLSGNPNINPGEEFESPYATELFPTDHSGDTPTSCEVQNNVDEQCVVDILVEEIGNAQGGFGTHNNCQSFAFSVVNQCRNGPQIVPEE